MTMKGVIGPLALAIGLLYGAQALLGDNKPAAINQAAENVNPDIDKSEDHLMYSKPDPIDYSKPVFTRSNALMCDGISNLRTTLAAEMNGHPSAADLAAYGCRFLEPDLPGTVSIGYRGLRSVDVREPSGFDAHGWVTFPDLRN
jgi:hypothetical protein